MPFSEDIFDDAVFGNLNAPRHARASVYPSDYGQPAGPNAPDRQRMDIDALMAQSVLSFTSLLASDQNVRVSVQDTGYKVSFGNSRLAFDMSTFKRLLEEDNEGVDLTFTDDLASYSPEDGLVRKTRVPLWIMKQLDGRVVQIQRAW